MPTVYLIADLLQSPNFHEWQVHSRVRFTPVVFGKILLGFGFHSYKSKELHENLAYCVVKSLLFSSVLNGKNQLPLSKELEIVFLWSPTTIYLPHLNQGNHFITSYSLHLCSRLTKPIAIPCTCLTIPSLHSTNIYWVLTMYQTLGKQSIQRCNFIPNSCCSPA